MAQAATSLVFRVFTRARILLLLLCFYFPWFPEGHPTENSQSDSRLQMAHLQNLSVSTARLLPTTEEVEHSNYIIRGIDEDINKLETQLQALRRKRDLYASYISPFRRLPTEILICIMGLALKKDVSLTTLTQICSRLRYIALETTKFWSNIQFYKSRLA